MQNLGKSKFPSALLYVLTLALLVGGVIYFFKDDLTSISIFSGNAGLIVDSFYEEAEVYIDGKQAGTTPYETEDISAKEHTIRLKNESNAYETSINFLKGTQVAVNRDTGVSEVFSSGQNFWIEQNGAEVLTVISDPAGASVYIDNTEVGKTPYSVDNLSVGEYDLRVSYPGYEVQNTRINIQKGYKLNASFDLFPLPVPPKVEEFADSGGLYQVISDNSSVTADPVTWVAGILYWNKTRGINLAGMGLNKEPVFDYFIDYKGFLYDASGTLVTDPSALTDIEQGAYLGRYSDGTTLTKEASTTFQALFGKTTGGKQAKILATGVGWLRVRGGPGISYDEVSKVNVGESFAVLEEASGWAKIQVSDELTGWVSTDYVELTE